MVLSSEVRPTKLFLGGISQNTTTKDLRVHFSEYGRVLDCVAMRRDDGRSRSFGYVTLDSLEAAKKCIAKAQKVDGRVIDVKLAVPERTSKDKPSGSSVASSTTTAVSKRKQAKDAADDLLGYGALLDDEEASTGTLEDGSESEAMSTHPVPLAEELSQKLQSIGAPPGLSLPLTGLPTARPPPPGFAPLPRPPPPGFAPPPPPPGMGPMRPPAAEEKLVKTIAVEDSFDETSTVAPSSNASPETVLVDCADESDEDAAGEQVCNDQELPSAGSALHAAGQCRPCNFFGKGRCGNGKDCVFCHMPHQKRKPTRQEKRDRKSQWLEREGQKLAEEASQNMTIVLREVFDFLPTDGPAVAAAAAAGPAPQVFAAPSVPAQAMFNFDDYSDISDDEDESTPAATVAKTSMPVYQEPGPLWSREDLLCVKVALTA